MTLQVPVCGTTWPTSCRSGQGQSWTEPEEQALTGTEPRNDPASLVSVLCSLRFSNLLHFQTCTAPKLLFLSLPRWLSVRRLYCAAVESQRDRSELDPRASDSRLCLGVCVSKKAPPAAKFLVHRGFVEKSGNLSAPHRLPPSTFTPPHHATNAHGGAHANAFSLSKGPHIARRLT